MVASQKMFLSRFHVIRPAHENAQQHAIEWLAAAHAMAERRARNSDPTFDVDAFCAQMRRFIARFGCGPEKISKRGHALPDFTHFNWGAMRVFNVEKDPCGAGMAARSAFFEETAERTFKEFYESESCPPDDLIHVTCTGYVSPSGAQALVAHKGWHASTTVTHAYHMGCYATLPAVRMAAGLLASPLARRSHLHEHAPLAQPRSARVDVVHTELCTLHLNPSAHDPEQLVVQSLFADGFVKYSLSPERPVKGPGFEVLAVREEILPDTETAMTWRCSDWGMRMSLAREVPSLIAEALEGFLERMFAQADADFRALRGETLFAVHPGGPKIIDRVQEVLGLRDDQVADSKRVLFECGNMSSATLPHIWELIGTRADVPAGTRVASLAFGPGLSVCGALLVKI